jgi:hypothetical protein
VEASKNQEVADQLLRAYKSAVLQKGREYDPTVSDFGEAVQAMPRNVAESMRKAYAAQVGKLGEEE